MIELTHKTVTLGGKFTLCGICKSDLLTIAKRLATAST
jgi:hypothetical protein